MHYQPSSRCTSAVAVLGVAGVVCALINLVGALLYLGDNSLWVYVPPIGALVMFALLFVKWRIAGLVLAYTTVILVSASYVVENWRWTIQLFDEGWWRSIFELFQSLLLVGSFVGIHFRQGEKA